MFEKLTELYIVFTRNCNLKCEYCYQSKKKKNMNEETIDNIIEFIKRHDTIDTINLFGGEPFYAYKKIEYFIDQLIKLKNETNRKFYLFTNTNGTILNEEVIELLKKISDNFEFRYIVSLDGNKKMHDSKRKFINGNGSYDLIMDNLKQIKNKVKNIILEFHTVISHEYAQNFLEYTKEIIRNPLFDNGSYEWAYITNENKIKEFSDKEIENIYSGIMKLNKEGYSVNFLINRFHNIIKNLDYKFQNPFFTKSYCRNGEWIIAIDYNGDVLPCDYYLNLKDTSKHVMFNVNTDEEPNDNHKRNLKIQEYIQSKSNRCSMCKSAPFCYICIAATEVMPCSFDIKCKHNKKVFEILEKIKFVIE